MCYVTPAEHLCLPTIEDVKVGTITSKIAAHAADVARGNDLSRDIEMSKARKNLDWEAMYKHAIDPEHARMRKAARDTGDDEACSMCGEYCAIKMVKDHLKK